MKKCIVIMLFAGILSFALPQSINLTGSVKDSATLKGIAGAVVALKGLPLSTATDSSGGYALTNSGAAHFAPGKVSPAKTPIVKQGCVCFGIIGNSEFVHIDVCDLLGRIIAPVVEKKLDRGSYRFNPFGKGLSAGRLCFVKLGLGSAEFLFRVLDVNVGGGYGLSRTADFGASGEFAKPAALAIDTIVVTAAGYAAAAKPISSYSGLNDVLLAAAPGRKAIISFD